MTATLWDLIGNLLRPVQPPTTHAPPRSRAADPAPSLYNEPVGRGFPTRAAPPNPAPCLAPNSPAVLRSAIRDPESTIPTLAQPASHIPRLTSMESRYDAVTRLMLQRYSIRVRKWRSSMSGIAWCLTYRDGSVKRLIEAPRPRGPMSAAIFLHEIGHHAIGFNVYKPRCLEEYHAWRWSLEAMAENGLNITDQVRYRMHLSLWYAVAKARRRGLRALPPELEPFTERPRRPRSSRTSRA